MIVAADGTTYVTGVSVDNRTSVDVITIKYSSNGSVQWRRRYDSGTGSYESGKALAVDRFGNVYVAGSLDGPGRFSDYLLLKYAGDGHLLWSRVFTSSHFGGWGNAVALAAVVDDFDDVYISGRSGAPEAANSGYDIVTVKLNPEGQELWHHRHSGFPAGAWGDEVSQIALDPFGDLIIAGRGTNSTGRFDWIVAKVDGIDGSSMWHRYKRGVPGKDSRLWALTVDSHGNTLVTGNQARPRGDTDVLTAKYSPTGRTLWLAWYNSPGSGDDTGYAIAMDKSDNVFVTGVAWPTSGPVSGDAITLKYDYRGRLQWKHVMDGPDGGVDFGTAVVPTEDGGVYVGGGLHVDSRRGVDLMTLRYSPDGEVLWRVLYDGAGHGSDSVSFLGIDEDGGLYATGRSIGRLGDDFATIKYVER